MFYGEEGDHFPCIYETRTYILCIYFWHPTVRERVLCSVQTQNNSSSVSIDVMHILKQFKAQILNSLLQIFISYFLFNKNTITYFHILSVSNESFIMNVNNQIHII